MRKSTKNAVLRIGIVGILSAASVAPASAKMKHPDVRPKTIPLSLAVRLLAPPGTVVDFAPGVASKQGVIVPAGTKVVALEKMLSGIGLQDENSGNTMTIEPIGAMYASETPPSIPAGPLSSGDYTSPGFVFQGQQAAMPSPPHPPSPAPLMATAAPLPPPEHLSQTPLTPENLPGHCPCGHLTTAELNAQSAAQNNNVHPHQMMASTIKSAPLPAPTNFVPMLAPAQDLAPPPPPDMTWTAGSGMTFDSVLQSWAQRAGWTVLYNTNINYPIEATATFNGPFLKAVEDLTYSVHSHPPPLVQPYTGNHVILVTTAEGN